MANPHTEILKAKGIRVAEWLVEQKVDIVVAKENLYNKKGPSYVFADAGVECKVSDDDLNIIIEGFRTEGQH